jgi:ABC-2 type transport system permease protein
MKKIILIIQREYLTRVKKRSFIIMTILGPILMASLVIVPIYLATHSDELKTVAVLDETGIFRGKFTESETLKFHYLDTGLDSAKAQFTRSEDHALLYIPKPSVTLPSNAIIYTEKSVGINVISHIRNIMSRELEQQKLSARLAELQTGEKEPVDVDQLLQSIKTSVDVSTMKIEEDGSESKSYTELNMVLGFIAGLLIYFFIFAFGSQVMRGIIEEKTSRIVEVIVSSVKPFQLMMGKIIGVGMVGLTQFLLWVVLTFGIVTVFTASMSMSAKDGSVAEKMIKNQVPGGIPNGTEGAKAEQDVSAEIVDAISTIDFPVMIGSFLFYFLFGYLMYAALFAAIGGAVDNEADTQQFMIPITIPLILSIMLMQFIVQDPHGPMAFWLSVFPLTSPVVMMIRIPFSVMWYEVVISMVTLILGFLGTTWLAGKIYRTGILMYGKKINYAELWKWIRY